MRIGIVLNQKIKETKEVLNKLITIISSANIDYKVIELTEQDVDFDVILAIGGDGTILQSARFFAKYGIPVMGINLGRLGFLSLITPDNLSKLTQIILTKSYEVQERMMLKSQCCTALNDFVIKGHSTNRTSKFNLYINDKLVSDYIADGLIISTPTGSTAYCLSAGGPILSPNLDSIVIVPICAHTMTARPLVLPTTEKITVRSTDESLDLSCDGQECLTDVQEVRIELSEYRAKLAFLKDDNFYSILRNKLHWGVSPVSHIE